MTETETPRVVPWLQLAKAAAFDRPLPAAEAMRRAGLDFEVELRKTFFEGSDGSPRLNPDRFHVVRKDTDQVFDIVSDEYEPVQYAEAFAFMDSVSPRYVLAGALKSGRQAVLVTQKPGIERLDVDLGGGVHEPHDLYCVLRTSHDRSRGVEGVMLPLNLTCTNQLTLGTFTANVPSRWSIKHTSTVHERLARAAAAWADVDRYAEVYAENARRLAALELDVDEARQVIRNVLPNRPRRDETVTSILDAWQSSPHVRLHGTGWGLVNAVSEQFEWRRSSTNRTPQSRLLGALEGANHRNINRTATLLLRRA